MECNAATIKDINCTMFVNNQHSTVTLYCDKVACCMTTAQVVETSLSTQVGTQNKEFGAVSQMDLAQKF